MRGHAVVRRSGARRHARTVRLLADAVSSSPALDTGGGSWLVIAAWALAGYWARARIAARGVR